MPTLPPTDSPTSGIQEAIDALPPGGGVVELEAGEYLLRRSIFPRPGVTLRGQGAATVLKPVAPHVTQLTADTAPDPTSFDLADIGPIVAGDQVWIAEPYTSGRRNNFGYFSRFMIVDAARGNRIEGHAVYGDPARQYRVDEGAFCARLFPAIFILDARDVTIDALTIDGGCDEPLHDDDIQLQSFMVAAVLQHASPVVRISNLNVRRWFSDGICVGGPASDSLVTGCVVEDCHAIGLHTGGGIKSSQWRGNISPRNRKGFLFCQGNRHVICAGNVIAHNAEHGIWGLGGTDRFNVVADNVCHHNGYCGIEAGGSVGNVIKGNICRNNSQAAPGTYAGIHLSKHRDNVVTGNLCLDDQDSPTQTTGLESLDPAGDNVIVDNLGA